jgi:hypothetical protein
MRKTIFHENWWLDAVAPGRWREAAAMRGGKVVGQLRYAERMMGNLRICEMPQLTRVLGPVIAPQGDKTETRVRFVHSIMEELLENIAEHDHVEMTLDPSCGDLAAFIAAGCDVKIMPTLLLDCRSPVPTLWEGLRDKSRNVVRRARERLTVRVVDDVDAFIACYLGNLGGEPSYFDVNLIRPVHTAAASRGQGRVLAATDTHGVVHAAVFFVWDDDKLYYFLSTRDRAAADLGAVSLLIWSGMEIAHELGRVFDFDGVTTDSRFKFMAAFGGELATRYVVTRTTSRFDTQRHLRGIAKAILKPEWLRNRVPAAAH